MTVKTNRSSRVVDALLEQTLEQFLTTHEQITPDRQSHFVVAFSGGRDSMALLHALHQLKSSNYPQLQLTAAYYWHPWRPLQQDLQTVHQQCKRLHVPWVILTPDLTLAKTESAAREDRYKQLAQLAHDLNASAVLTAHHQDDQIETVLFRILRGTGIEGLTGIPARRVLHTPKNQAVLLLRPLLELPRSEINAYIQTHQLPFVEDPTNVDYRFKRNFIRHEILPKVESAFPTARRSILQLAHLVAGDAEIIQIKMAEIWREIYDPETKSLDEIQFNQLSLPFQRRIIRQFLESAGIDAGLSKVEDVISFILGKNRELQRPGLYSLNSQRFLSIYRNLITIETPKKPDIEPLPISVPGEVSHQKLRATLIITPLTPEERLRPIDFSKFSEEEVYVDLSKYEGRQLYLRTRQQGDRIKPLGMSDPVKLKRFLISRSVPRFQRDWIPLLTADSEVLWAVGIGLSEEIRVKNRPTHRMILKRVQTTD